MNGVDIIFMLLIIAQAWLITVAMLPHEKGPTFPRIMFCMFPGLINTVMLMGLYAEKLNWIRWLQ